MFNILDFIDSKDIREYNKNTKFTPIEQAYLICYSRKTTIDEKLAAWHELLDTYSEEDFEMTYFGKMQYANGKKSNKQILLDTVALIERSIAIQKQNESLIFEAVYYKHDDIKTAQKIYFSNYYDALEYLKQMHTENEEMCGNSYQHYNCSAVAKIAARPYGKNSWFNTTFYFDNDMRITTIVPTDETLMEGWYNAAYLMVYIPLPFKKGDIVRLTRLTDTKYGVISKTPDEKYYRHHLHLNNNEDILQVTLDTFNADDCMYRDKGYFDCYGYNPLEFEKCSANELPDEQKNLSLLSEVYLDKITVGELMMRYSLYGMEAYSKY